MEAVAARAKDRGAWVARKLQDRVATVFAQAVGIECRTRLDSPATSASALAAAQQ